MASITFRFSTECEMTLTGQSYEEAYMQFKDFMHGDAQVQTQAQLRVCPPESDQVFFSLDQQYKLYEIASFKGNFTADIESRSEFTAITPADLSSSALWSGTVARQHMQSLHNPG